MPPQITCASALPGKTEYTKIAFSLAVLVHCKSLLDFFNLFESRLIFVLLYDSQNLVINAFSLGLLEAWFRRKEVKSTTAVGLCCTHKASDT